MRNEGTMNSPSKLDAARLAIGILAAASLLVGCSEAAEIDPDITLMPSAVPAETSVEPSPLPAPEETLFICLNEQPESLYLYAETYQYGSTRHETNAILQALYDGPFDLRDFSLEPVILASIPSLEAGDILYESVTVTSGEVYFNPVTLQPENLLPGSAYLPADCSSVECIRSYEGGEVEMLQMRVDFHLLPGLTWSDGAPLTAADSVFSYELDRDPLTPTTKYLINRTASYLALDEYTTRWQGIPGFLDPEYATNFWSPLPEHQLGGYRADEILVSELANQWPLSWGAYQIAGWEAEGLILTPNPTYFRRDEGLPAFDRLVFRFLVGSETSAIQQLLTGECDLVDESLLSSEALPTLRTLEEDGLLEIDWTPSAEIERIDFNLRRSNGDDQGLSFSDLRLRRAIAGCIDRPALVNDILLGYGLVTDSFISPENPASLRLDAGIPYDPDASREALDQIGWVEEDLDAATPRIARGVLDNLFGTTLEIDLIYSEGDFHEEIAEQIRSDLGQCGIGINLVEVEQGVLSEPWPEGYVFGGAFEMVLWPWPDWFTPFCEMYAGWEIPSDSNPFGSNASGYENSAYNGACRVEVLGIDAGEATSNPEQSYQQQYAEEVPSIPLFVRPRFIVYNPDLDGVEADALSFSILWNIEAIRLAE